MTLKNIWEKLKKHSSLLIVLLILAAGIAAYANSFQNEFVWDDNDNIVNNVYIKDWKYVPNFFSENLIAGAGFPSDYWRPILLFTYAIDWQAWNSNPFGYHLTNLLFHLGSALLIFFIIWRLFSERIPAAAAALIFAIHPIQTEAVTYIAGRGDVFSLFFTLAGLLFFLKARSIFKENASMWNYIGVAVFFLLSLLTKERSVMFPALLLVMDLFIWKTREFDLIKFRQFIKKSLIRISPFLLISAGYLALRATILNFQNTFNIYGAPNIYTENLAVRIFTFLKTIPVYLSTLFNPTGLHMERSYELGIETGFFNSGTLVGFLILTTLGILGIIAWRKNKPIYAFGALWFFATMFPISGIAVPVAGLIYEHYLYAPIIGLALLFGLGWSYLRQISGKNSLATGLAILLVANLIFLTIQRNRDWRDEITFYNQTLKYVPQSERVWNSLSMTYIKKEDFLGAEQALKASLLIQPNDPQTHYYLGSVYKENNNFNEAEKEYKIAIKLAPQTLLPRQALYELYRTKFDDEKIKELMNNL